MKRPRGYVPDVRPIIDAAVGHSTEVQANTVVIRDIHENIYRYIADEGACNHAYSIAVSSYVQHGARVTHKVDGPTQYTTTLVLSGITHNLCWVADVAPWYLY